MYYAPVRHSPCGAFDLHVLGLPPAFALSQDQTLMFDRLMPYGGITQFYETDRLEHSLIHHLEITHQKLMVTYQRICEF